ncbi:MAG: hypothetical protein ABW352_18715 [Polyangiales bacterium]
MDRLLLLCSACAIGCDDDATQATPRRDAEVQLPAVDAGTPAAMDASAPVLDASSVKYVSLVDMENWRRYDAAVDPLKSHQPAEIECPDSATYLEYGAYEVDTTRCNYALSYTPAMLAVPAGTPLRVSLLHYDLIAPQPAEAHIAVLFGDSLQWEQTIPIPARGNGVDATFVSTVPLAFQDPIRLHLHNHGGNTYLLVSLEAPETP